MRVDTADPDARAPQSFLGLVDVVGVVDSDAGGSEADGDVESVGVVGSVLTLAAGVVSTTGGAARRVRGGAGRGRWVVVSVRDGVSSAVGSAGAVTAGTRGAGRLIALFVVRGAGQRKSVDTTATAAAAPPMLTNAAGLRPRSTAGAGAGSGSRSSASSSSDTAAHRPLPLRCAGRASSSSVSTIRAVARLPVADSASPEGGV